MITQDEFLSYNK